MRILDKRHRGEISKQTIKTPMNINCCDLHHLSGGRLRLVFRTLAGGSALRALLLFPMLCAGFFFIAVPQAYSQAQEPLVVSLEAYKVSPATADSGETFAKADTAQPGDVIEYRATYTNTTGRALPALSLDIPIPPALTWLPHAAATIDGKAASPAPASASLDGRNYMTLPLTAATAAELVRVVRWDVSSIPSRGVILRAVRARVNAEAAAPQAAR